MKRISLALLCIVLAVFFWSALRSRLRTIPPPTADLLAKSENVRILRDEWGVPHVFGETDADAAFGLAYAQAEDDFPTIKLALAAGAGKLSLLKLSTDAIGSDHLTRLLGIRRELEREYATQLSEEFRKVLDGFADGLNLYVSLHAGEGDARFFPYVGRDIAAAFLYRLALLEGVGRKIGHHSAVSDPTAFAISRARSADDVARVFFSSDGYEAQVVSGEGWNMSGATLPGAPMILQGHNETLAWAHTTNHPPLVEAYSLEMDPKHPERYRYDGEWRELERLDSDITVDLGPFDWTVHRDAFHSVHGPVLRTETGMVAFRYAGQGNLLPAVEQWFEMNRATNFEEWKKAMGRHGLPLFNTIFADRQHLFYVYNALLPMRKEASAAGLAPGNSSRFVWNEYLAFDKLPIALDPPSGFVQSGSSTPFSTTKGDGNPMASDLYRQFGVETRMTNRALRLLDLLATGPVDRARFLEIKSDREYDTGAPIYHDRIARLVGTFISKTAEEKEGIALLKGWDRKAVDGSRGAALAVLTMSANATPEAAFRASVVALTKKFKRLDVALGDVQRLRRGKISLPLAGGPDTVGSPSESLLFDVELGPKGAESWAISQNGSSNRPGSKHYADQAQYFARGELRRHWRTEKEVRAHLELEYHPGEELKHAAR